MKLPTYPQDFFQFGNAVKMSDTYINMEIKRLVDELLEDKECNHISSSTGDTKIQVARDEEEILIVEVYKDYHRYYVELEG